MSCPTLNDPVGCTNPSGWTIADDQYDPNRCLAISSTGWCKPFDYSGDVDNGSYVYDPSFGTGLVFLVLFGILTIAHAAFTIKSRYWVAGTLSTLFGAVEAAGWLGRTLSGHKNDFSATSRSYFIVQVVTLTFAPAFASAAIYFLFKDLVALRPSYSFRWLSPKRLAVICIVIDLVSLSIQAAGGGIAGSAQRHVILSGIVVQLLSMLLFSIVGISYWSRSRNQPPEVSLDAQTKPWLVGVGIAIASVLLLLRGFYRVAELSQGWKGHLNTTEGYMLGLDATPMVIALFVLLVTHPLVAHLPRDAQNAPRPSHAADFKRAAFEKQASV